MQLSADLLVRFQDRYFEAFAERISLETAEAELLELAGLIRITNHLSKDMEDENYGKKAHRISNQSTTLKVDTAARHHTNMA
jgi:hypothetical protein